MQGNFIVYFMIFIIIYIYSYLYLCICTPSYQHFKAFPVSKFNFETSFLYQLFKVNSNFIVKKLCKVIYLSAYDVFFKPCKIIYLSISFTIHLLVSTFQREFKFHSEKAMQGYLFVCLWCLCFLYYSETRLFICLCFMIVIITPSVRKYKSKTRFFPVRKYKSKI